jgi:type IV pilus assembly protein PilW
VMAAVYSTYRSQQTSYIIQDQVSATQQNIRAAMYSLVRDIQMAGFNPKNVVGNVYGITTAGVNTITFTADNGPGDTAGVPHYSSGGGAPDSDETITYSLNGNKELIRNVGGTNQTLAQNIEAIGFAYAYVDANKQIVVTANNNIIWAIDSSTPPDGTLDLRLDTNDDGVIAQNDDSDNNATIDGSVLATPVANTDIKSVKIWILARTEKPIQGYNVSKQYVVGNTVVSPDSKYMYRLLSETVMCRNLNL